MEKSIFRSKTVIGGFLLALEAGLIAANAGGTEVKAIVAFLGVFLTVYGFRDAINK